MLVSAKNKVIKVPWFFITVLSVTVKTLEKQFVVLITISSNKLFNVSKEVIEQTNYVLVIFLLYEN